jgi:transcriptional regulator GlxA family with amidase domain
MTRAVAMLMYAGGQSLDVTGPMEVFALASRQALEDDPASEPPYRLHFIAAQRGPLVMASGLVLHAELACEQLPAAIDTVLISGGMGDALDGVRANAELVAWIASLPARVRRLGAICSGALLLAEAGVLDGRQATTHWLDVAELSRRYPRVRVVPDAIYVQDGAIWTSAGITAGMDLALAMVAQDLGMPLALKVAKRMVMMVKRSGGQTQYSNLLDAQHSPDVFADLVLWLREDLQRTRDIEVLAERMHMSPRHFRRRFAAVFATTPQNYLEQLRVEAAKALLENTRRELKRIADECGFASEEGMRRAFVRQCGVRPAQYRERFGALGR